MSSPGGSLPVGSYRRSQFRHLRDPRTGAFHHNYDRDLHLFIIWEAARHKEDKVLNDLADAFTIRRCFEITWSKENAVRNFARLYKTPHRSDPKKPKKVGTGSFLCVVVEDGDPYYTYDRSVSGKVECVNKKVAARKRLYREWCGGYSVHSSNSLQEFFEQGAMLLGARRLRAVVSEGAWDGEVEQLAEDLAGASGWRDFPELFDNLSLACNYVVLRNFEVFPESFFGNEDDVDVLCDDLRGFICASNAVPRQQSSHEGGCTLTVSGQEVPLDARVVGDGYYDTRWQLDILQRQVLHEDLVPRPREDDYFFSLLYHTRVQKRRIKDVYRHRLPRLASAIGMEWFSAEDLASDAACAAILSGFMEPCGYRYVKPSDPRVRANARVLAGMRTIVDGPEPWHVRAGRRGARWLDQRLPQGLVARVPEGLRSKARRFTA